MDTRFIATQHDPAAVAAACLLAASASYVSLELARRVYTSTGKARLLWWAGGAVTMGTGIWAMHFIAMLGFEAGLPLGFALGATTLSWLAAIAAGAVGLACASRERLSAPMLLGGASAMAAAICGMHYIGMTALELTPGIVWRQDRVIGSVLVAWTASAVALGLFFAMRRLRGPRRLAVQGVAALVMGAAISGMHFLGMAAAQLPLGTVCTSSDGLAGRGLLALVASATLLLLGAAMLLAAADARHQARQRRMAQSLQAANTELQQANAELHRLAYRDPLTGASNRTHLEERLQHACALLASQGDLPRHGKARLAVLFIDLDGFKPVNDSFGHACGDALLQQVAERLARASPGTDTVARVGGDEFVVLLESADALASGIATAEDLLAALRQPFVLPAHEVTLSASIGIAVHPDHGPADPLVARADAAMYAAKARGGGGWAVYDAQMTQGTGDLVALQQALRGALARHELSLHYQPKVCAHDGAVHGVEALLRWQHPPRGMVSPAVFIPVAERFGLIGELGRWVIDEACAQMARWNAIGLTCRVAVNLSPLQLRQTDLADQVADALARHRIEPAQLALEITETAMMENLDQQLAQLERLAGLGVRLSIDDFGTGYSCLAWLRRLPVRQLKLDRSLVIDVTEAEESRAVVDAVVRLAHALRLEVVAEGVETEPQAAVLRTLGCDVLQGWLFARPMPADELPAWLTRHAETRPGRSALAAVRAPPRASARR